MRTMSLSAVLLVVMCWTAVAAATQNTDAITGTSAKCLANVLGSNIAAFSCSSASAESYGGVAVAYAKSNSAAIAKAAQSCADAVSKAFSDAGAECKNTEVTAFVTVAATACARASLSIRTDTLATVSSSGRSKAFSTACGFSSAYSAAMGKALATAFANGMGENGKGCDAYTTVDGSAKVQAFSVAITKGLAASYVYAVSSGQGSSSATGSAMFAADVGVYAKAIGNFMAYGCTKCSKGARCGFCANGLKDGDESTTDSLAIAAKGKFALASAFSDAVSSVCEGRIKVEAAAEACLKAFSDVCVQMTAKACGFASATGSSCACSTSYSSGSAFGLSEAFGTLIVDAAATAFKNDECSTQAFATVTADVFSNVKVLDIIKAVQTTCASSSGSGSATATSVASALRLHENQNYAKALSDAISAVVSSCNCGGAGWCCNCAKKSNTCPY